MGLNSKNRLNSTDNTASTIFILATNTCLILLVIFYSSQTDNNMIEARRRVSLVLNTYSSFNLRLNESTRNRINFLFIQDPVVRATLWHFHEIRPSLILASYGAMITFVVMVLTSFTQFLD